MKRLDATIDIDVQPIKNYQTTTDKTYEMRLAHIKRRLKEYALEQEAMSRFDVSYALKKGYGIAYANRRRQIRKMIARQLRKFTEELFEEIKKIEYFEVK